MLLYGGVFDPPHRAHVRLAALARDAALGPEGWLVFVPAARSPLKAAGPRASDQDRVAMVRTAIAAVPRAAVWTDEIDRAAAGDGPSFWIDTLERARAAFGPRASLHFLIGADQAADFHRWRRPREILALAHPVVILRAPLESADRLAASMRAHGFWTENELAEWSRCVLSLPLMDTSSTDIREALAHGRGDPQLAEALDPAVLDYILVRGLYR